MGTCTRMFLPRNGDRVLTCVLEAGHHPPNLHRDPSGADWTSGEAVANFDAFCAEHGIGTAVSPGENGTDDTDDERDR